MYNNNNNNNNDSNKDNNNHNNNTKNLIQRRDGNVQREAGVHSSLK